MFQTHGLDAIVHVRFLKGAIYILALQCVFGAVVLFPVNATSVDGDATYGSAIVSLSNIPLGSVRLAAHTVSVVFNTIVTCFVLYKIYDQFVRDRRRYRRKKVIANFTTMVREIPTKFLNGDETRKYFEGIYRNQIKDVVFAPNIPNIWKTMNERNQAVYDLEKAKTELKKKGVRPTIRLKDPGKHFLKSTDAIDHYTNVMNRCEVMIYGALRKGEDIPEEGFSKLLTATKTTILNFDKAIEGQIEKLKKKKTEENIRTEAEKVLPRTHVAFVTFEEINTCISCNNITLTHNTRHWITDPAPEPEDIRWDNLYLRSRQKTIRRVILWILVFWLTLFWSIPVGALTSLFRIKNIEAVFGSDITEHWGKFAIGIVTGVLPSLILIILVSVLPLILRLIVQKFEGNYTKAEDEASAMTKFFVFLMVNVFFVTLVVGSFFGLLGQLESFISHPEQIIGLLANSLPQQANFFINYVMVSSFVSYGMLLTRIVDILLRIVKKFFLAKSKRDFREVDAPSADFVMPVVSKEILIFVIVTTYSTIAPLIIPFGLVFFCIAFITVKYNQLYVLDYPWEGGGMIWPRIFNRMIVGLIIYQLTLTGVFGIFLFPAGVIVSVICILGTASFAYWVHLHLDARFLHGAMDDCLLENVEEGIVDGSEGNSSYHHPVTLPLIRPEKQYDEDHLDVPKEDGTAYDTDEIELEEKRASEGKPSEGKTESIEDGKKNMDRPGRRATLS
eukprot:TRINITY_DN2753_c1_g1_i4.p1 TRINITY_DN2753_c1_g1~~TRINITY_DN2753_c1_g1_i4.p1  ORF type:complete len:836 (+),score=166.87 TRINITY_DN2753_c1_g1_i4:320-2509(+)